MANSVWIGWFGASQGSSSGGGPTFPDVTVTGQFYAPVSATIPGYSFTGDTNTGYGSSAADTLALFAGGTTPRVTMTATALTSTVPILLPDGTSASGALQFTNDAGLGLYRSADNDMRLIAPAGGAIYHYINGGDRFYVNASSANLAVPLNTNSEITRTGSNGQVITGFQTLTELTTIAAAATTDTTIQMPANSVVLGVSVRVTVAIPTATTFTVGDSGSAARFSTAAVSVAANSTDPGTKAGAYYNASALSVRITPDAPPADNTGRVRVTIYYYSVTPPTS